MSISKVKCPLCRKPSAPQHAPFCSQGCRDRDLLQWLVEGYALPGAAATEDTLDSEHPQSL